MLLICLIRSTGKMTVGAFFYFQRTATLRDIQGDKGSID